MSAFKTVVAFEGRILLDRAICLNEEEAQRFLKDRIEESSPLRLRNLSTEIVERVGDSALYEVDAVLQGTLSSCKPLAKEAVKQMVQTLTQRAGFDTENVSVRAVEETSDDEEADPDEDRVSSEISDEFVKKTFGIQPRLKSYEVESLKTGDKIQITRSGFYEEAEVVSVDPIDRTVEIRTPHAYTTEWIPAGRIMETVRK